MDISSQTNMYITFDLDCGLVRLLLTGSGVDWLGTGPLVTVVHWKNLPYYLKAEKLFKPKKIESSLENKICEKDFNGCCETQHTTQHITNTFRWHGVCTNQFPGVARLEKSYFFDCGDIITNNWLC